MAVLESAGRGQLVTARDAASLSLDVDGVVLLPGDDTYEAECATYNLAHARRPAVAVGVTSAGDVSSAVRFAARRGLPSRFSARVSAGHWRHRSSTPAWTRSSGA